MGRRKIDDPLDNYKQRSQRRYNLNTTHHDGERKGGEIKIEGKNINITTKDRRLPLGCGFLLSLFLFLLSLPIRDNAHLPPVAQPEPDVIDPEGRHAPMQRRRSEPCLVGRDPDVVEYPCAGSVNRCYRRCSVRGCCGRLRRLRCRRHEFRSVSQVSQERQCWILVFGGRGRNSGGDGRRMVRRVHLGFQFGGPLTEGDEREAELLAALRR